MSMCGRLLTQAQSCPDLLASLLLKVNPLGNKLNFSFFSKTVRPPPPTHTMLEWPNVAHFSKIFRATGKHIPTLYERGEGRGTATNKTEVKFVAGLAESSLMRTW